MTRIRLEDDEAFTPAVGMAIGFRDGTGNLRLLLSDAQGKQTAVELPKAWLRGHGGLVAFIASEGNNPEADVGNLEESP